ncbi:aminotransferase class III [Paraburkholderia eburnea]|uniref:Aminotransferase class III n=1 Tax=Paraburkholderia eburnea TaxID=1189126 RepID=A0A2S4MND2_9BURK|nr:aminotransferase class III [Paraburkholderia eburnea]PRZ26984.1 aminotransferase class III [Paraburkholderia eburnea]
MNASLPDLSAFWMPFMSHDGRQILDGTAGLWCVNAGHCRADGRRGRKRATIDLYEREGLFGRAAQMAPIFEREIHKLRGEPHVIDVRNLGLVGGVELEPREGAPGARAYETFVRCYQKGVLIRYTGDILAFSPPLIVDEKQIEEIFSTVALVLREVD